MWYVSLILLLISSTVNAATYYVKNGGDDSLAGTSDATAWATTAKVTATATTSDKVHFKCGSTWTTQFAIPAGGTSPGDPTDFNDANRFVVGSYYVSGGTTYTSDADSDNDGAGAVWCDSAGLTRPRFMGGASPSSAGSVPNSPWSSMVYIQNGDDYITIQDIYVYRSSGYGISLSGVSAANQALYTVLQHSLIEETIMGFIIAEAHSDYTIIKDNIGNKCVWGRYWGNHPLPGIHPGCMQVANNSDYVIFENNELTDLFGEGISISHAGQYGIIRGNKIFCTIDCRHYAIYVQSARKAVIENNLVVAGSNNLYGFTGIGAVGEGDWAAYSDYSAIIRNNVVMSAAGTAGYGINIDLWDGAISAGKTQQADIYGNTIIGFDKGFALWRDISQYTITFKGNTVIGSSLNCSGVGTIGTYVFDYNNWADGAPADAQCIGANDVASDPGFNYAGDFGLFDGNSRPSTNDFTPGNEVNCGDFDTTSLLTAADYTQRTYLYDYSTRGFSEYAMAKDYSHATRNTTLQDCGAVETGVSAPTQETAPFYNNTRGGAYSGSVTWESDATNDYCTGYTYASTNTTTYTMVGSANASDNATWQSWIGSTSQITCAIPVANGTYDLKGFFAEQYWGDEGGTPGDCVGDRKFNGIVEGVQLAEELDICALAGGPNRAIVITWGSITVNDGFLNLTLVPGTSCDLDNGCKPEIMGLGFTATSSTNTLTVNIPAPNTDIVNLYPNSTIFSAITECGATSSAFPDNTISVSVGSCTLSNGTIVAGATGLKYTPVSASTADNIGDCVLTLSDINENETCTLTDIDLVAQTKVEFTVTYNSTAAASITDWCWMAIDSLSDLSSKQTIIHGDSCTETTDGSGVMSISDNRFVADSPYKIIVYTPTTHLVGGDNIRNIPFAVHRTAR